MLKNGSIPAIQHMHKRLPRLHGPLPIAVMTQPTIYVGNQKETGLSLVQIQTELCKINQLHCPDLSLANGEPNNMR